MVFKHAKKLIWASSFVAISVFTMVGCGRKSTPSNGNSAEAAALQSMAKQEIDTKSQEIQSKIKGVDPLLVLEQVGIPADSIPALKEVLKNAKNLSNQVSMKMNCFKKPENLGPASTEPLSPKHRKYWLSHFTVSSLIEVSALAADSWSADFQIDSHSGALKEVGTPCMDAGVADDPIRLDFKLATRINFLRKRFWQEQEVAIKGSDTKISEISSTEKYKLSTENISKGALWLGLDDSVERRLLWLHYDTLANDDIEVTAIFLYLNERLNKTYLQLKSVYRASKDRPGSGNDE